MAGRGIDVNVRVRMQKIAICGKGGSGKSVVTRLLADGLRSRGHRVLVVDADESNTGLHRMLGFDSPPRPLLDLFGGKGKVEEEITARIAAGETEVSIQFIDREIPISSVPSEYILETDGIKLVEVGKILMSLEGCSCPMGIVSRCFLKKLRLEPDEVAVVDLEAVVEHFGRGVETGVDCALVVVDPSSDAVQIAARISVLAGQIQIADVWVVLNKITSRNIADRLTDRLERSGIKVIGSIAHDEEIFESCLEGRPIQGRVAAGDIEKVLDFLFP
jgi:CO dehydrogenase maturation factor